MRYVLSNQDDTQETDSLMEVDRLIKEGYVVIDEIPETQSEVAYEEEKWKDEELWDLGEPPKRDQRWEDLYDNFPLLDDF